MWVTVDLKEAVDIRVYSHDQHLGGVREIDWAEEEVELSCSLKVPADLTEVPELLCPELKQGWAVVPVHLRVIEWGLTLAGEV